EVQNGSQTAVAAMYALPFGSSFANVPDVGGPLTQWHVHRDLCLTSTGKQRFVVGITTQDGTCAPGTSKLGDTPMLHVWTIPNPLSPRRRCMGPDPQTLPRASRLIGAAPRSVDAIQGLTSVACAGRADFDRVRASTPFVHHQAVVDSLASRHADAETLAIDG